MAEEIFESQQDGASLSRQSAVAASHKTEEAVQCMLDFPKVTLGSDLTIKHLIEEGQRF